MNSQYRALALVDNIPSMDIRQAARESLSGEASITKMVTVFHQVYNMPIVLPQDRLPNFAHMPKERLAMRFGLVVEEFMELCEAMGFRADINFYYKADNGQFVKAVSAIEQDLTVVDGKAKSIAVYDAAYNWSDAVLVHDNLSDDEMHMIVRERMTDVIMKTEERDVPEVADALFDLKYVITGFELETGIDSDACATEGQASNLSKLGEDGYPIYREDGKVMKGPNFFPPNMASAIDGNL